MTNNIHQARASYAEGLILEDCSKEHKLKVMLSTELASFLIENRYPKSTDLIMSCMETYIKNLINFDLTKESIAVLTKQFFSEVDKSALENPYVTLTNISDIFNFIVSHKPNWEEGSKNARALMTVYQAFNSIFNPEKTYNPCRQISVGGSINGSQIVAGNNNVVL